MARFGCYNPFPFRFGGGKRPIEIVHETLLESYAPVLNVEEGGLAFSESYAEAKLLSNIMVASERLKNQAIPSKALEAVPDFERMMRIQPLSTATDNDRRDEIAGKLRGLFNNAEPDIRDACSKLLGENFVQIHYVDESSAMTYWPGVQPGQPAMPWASWRALVLVEAQKLRLTSDQYSEKVGRCARMLDNMLPAWMGFDIFRYDEVGGVDGFYLDESLLDEVGL